MGVFLKSFRLSHLVQKSEALPILTLLGFFVGIAAGLLLIVVKYTIEAPLHYILLSSENYEKLEPWFRFFLVLGGSILIALIWNQLPKSTKKIGVPHVIESIQSQGGRLPAKNIFVQYIGSLLALWSGQSVGREGPSIHIGAGVGSLIGQKLGLPNHSIQVLVGCGVAGAIAAVFNTPLAGVVFAMEIILVEYSITWAVPIMASAFTASLLSQGLWDGDINFSGAEAELQSLVDIPWLIALGFFVGTAAALFNALIRLGLRFRHVSALIRLPLAGLLTATVAFWIPEVMGTGYDTISSTLDNKYAISALIIIFAAKLLVTAGVIGLGMPAGLIGPTLVIGATLGGIAAYGINIVSPDSVSNINIFVLIGTSAMMSAVLQAPITALITVLEFSSSTAILFPAMIAIIIANLTCRTLFNQPSIFISILQVQGMTQFSSPVTRALTRMNARDLGVPAIMPILGKMSANDLSILIKSNDYLLFKQDKQLFTLESHIAHKLLEQELSLIDDMNDTTDLKIDTQTWVGNQNELIWLPLHSTLEQVLRTTQGRNIGGVWLSKNEDTPPHSIFPKRHLIELITKIGE